MTECTILHFSSTHPSFVYFAASKLPGLLMFATRCRQIPPMGYCTQSFVTVTQNTSVFPNANTCPLELEVPGLVNSFDEFKRSIDSAINYQEEGFGII